MIFYKNIFIHYIRNTISKYISVNNDKHHNSVIRNLTLKKLAKIGKVNFIKYNMIIQMICLKFFETKF